MIGLLRKHMKIIFWMIIIIIVPAFVFWGVGTGRQRRAHPKYQVFGKINDETVNFDEFYTARDREMQMLNYFLNNIIRGKRYRKPYHDYWQSLRNIFIERELAWEERNLSRSYLLQFGGYASMGQSLPEVSDKGAENYINHIMFPSPEVHGERDDKKYNEYLRKYGLTADELFEEAKDNIRVERMVAAILRMDPQEVFLSQVWERMLLVRELPKWNVRATEEEIGAYIQAMLGVSSDQLEEKYTELLESGNISEKELRVQIEENIKTQKLRCLIADTGAVSKLDAKELFDSENTKRKIAYKEISADEMKSAFEILPEVLGYYYEHRGELKDPKMVSVDYIVLKTDSFRSLVRVTDEEARKEYESNPDKYGNEDGEQKGFSEIEHDIRRELAKKKARSLAEEKAKIIFDFSSGAEMHNVAEQNGLELLHSDYISEEVADVEGIDRKDEFISAALATEIGKVSSIIDVGDGFAVLSPTEFYEPGSPTPGSAAERVAKKLASIEAEDFLDSAAIEIPAKAQAKYILLPEDYYQDKVEATEEDLKKEYEARKTFMERRDEEIAPYEEMKETLKERVLRRNAMIKLSKEGQKTLECSTMEEFEKAAQSFDPPLEIRTTNYILRSENIDENFNDANDFMRNQFKHRMFKTKVGEFSMPFRLLGKGFVVLTTIKKRPLKTMGLRELYDIAKKENLTDEEKSFFEAANFSSEEYEQFVTSLPELLDDGAIGASMQELHGYYDVVRRGAYFAEDILITPERRVVYVCVEKENIKDYLNKPFDFEIREYYNDNRDEFFDSSKERTRSYVEVKEEVKKKLSEKRAEDFEKAVEKYYEKHKEDFSRIVNRKKTLPPLDDVREEVIEKTREQELDRLSFMRAERLPIAKATKLEYQARKQGLVLYESNFFSLDKESRIDGFLTGSEEVFREAAFRTRLGEVSMYPVHTEKGYCILSPFAEKPYEEGKAKDFVDALPAVKEIWKSGKSSSLAHTMALHISSEIAKKMDDENADFALAAKEAGFEFEESGYFRLTDESLAGFEEHENLVSSIFFRLEQQERDADEPPVDIIRLMNNNVFLYRGVSEITPSEEDFLASIVEYNNKLMPMRTARAYEEWLHVLARQSKIEPLFEHEQQKEAEKQRETTEEPS